MTMTDRLTRRRFTSSTLVALVAGRLFSTPAGAEPQQPEPKEGPFPFYAMDTGLRGPDVPTLEKKVQLLKKLGFRGIGYTLNHRELPQLLELLDGAGLELSAVYTTPALEGEPDPALPASVKLLKGRATRIELAVTSKKFKPSDPEGDRAGVELLKRVSDLAGDTGPVASVYPHRGYWTERVEDGARLARLAGRKNVGTHFNLVHWKWLPQRRPVAEVLKEALPHLFCVTVNGLKGDAIVPLDEGDFDLAGFLKTLHDTGYRGRVGLQGFGMPGPSEEHLGRSMRRWRDLMRQFQG
jgi:sugar phosphate isomerase/epimerase